MPITEEDIQKNNAIYYATELDIAGKLLQAHARLNHSRDCCLLDGFKKMEDCESFACRAVMMKLEEWQLC